MEKIVKIDGVIVEKEDHLFEYMTGMKDNRSFASSTFTDETKGLKKGDTLTVKVCTDGGNIDAGIKIYNECKELQARGVTVTTFNVCKQHSIGHVIMLGGSIRKGYNSSEGLIHLPAISAEYFLQFGGGINTAALEPILSDLRLEENRILDIYEKETGANRAALTAIMHAEKTLSAKQLKNLGFLTEIVEAGTAAPEGALQNLFYSNKFMLNLKTQKVAEKKKDTSELRSIFNNLKATVKRMANIAAVNFDFTTQEGGTLNVDRADDQLAVGDAATITDADGNVSEDGEVTLEDGRVVVVAVGVITEIRDAATTNEEMEALQKENESLKAQLAEMTSNLKEVSAQMENFEKIVKGLEGVTTASNYTPAARAATGGKKADADPANASSKESTAATREKLRNLNKR